MSEERRLAVLRAIVEDYVATEEPVGSRALVDRHRLGVSPATVRNDMAVLEEEGLIRQPHTSAGRVPTDKGYRAFVDRLTEVKPMTTAEKRAIATFLGGALDVDDVVQRSVRLLAQMTRQVAVMQYPSLARSTVRHVEVVALAAGRLLVVLILSSGRVEQRVLEVARDLGEEDLADLRVRLSRAVVGEQIGPAALNVAALADEVPPEQVEFARALSATVLEALSEHGPGERVAVGGTANLARFEGGLEPMLEALEEHVVLLKLLGHAADDAITVRIGAEGPYEELASTSVVATGYGRVETPLATLGVVGPTRMDYPATMAAVRAVASYVSRILDEG